MIVIFSTREDISTTETMRWLDQLGAKRVVRINDDDSRQRPVRLILTDNDFELCVGGTELRLGEIDAVWYRKGSFWFKNLSVDVNLKDHPGLAGYLNAKLTLEERRLKEYFHYLIAARARTLGHAEIAALNKMIVLSRARKEGLSVPSFMVTNSSDAVTARLHSRGPQVTKAMSDCVYHWDFEQAKTAYFSYTEQVDPTEIAAGESTLPFSLIQDQVEKAYEVRSFYLDGEFYSVAIHSQSDTRTRIDYRKYNYERPNRNVPYRLPEDVSGALQRLFVGLGLNTGSVDLMVAPDGTHHFLEINPSGQYEGISHMCNYQISMRVAQWLIGSSA